LAGYPPLDVGYRTGILPAKHTIRIMLAELDDVHESTLQVYVDGDQESLRLQLLRDFARLHAIIG